jgi:hypothetical protein
MDRRPRLIRSRALPAFLLALVVASCASPADRAPRYFYHIGSIGCSASPSDGSVLRIEDRPAEGVFRVTNQTGSDIRFYYDSVSSFGDYQMLFVRFRDGTAKPVPNLGVPNCDFYSPKVNWSDLVLEGEKPERRSFTIPAGGYWDIKRDLKDFFAWWRDPRTAAAPCQVQVRLFGYLDDTSPNGIGAVTDWQPSPCPGE